MATCPECEYDEIDTDDFEEGDALSCPECGKQLTFLGNDEVDVADGDDDDLDDDEEEDDEELADDEDGDDEDDLDDDEDEELDDDE